MADFEILEENRQIYEDYLWLKYLEIENNNLNPTSSNFSRESKKFKKLGTTPFTLTKRMKKDEEEESFGFQITHTKPISVSYISKNSPADKIHLEIGDLIIFINNVNIVDMAIQDIINLINSDDDVLFLEIFRRARIQMERVVTIESETSSIPYESQESKESHASKESTSSKVEPEKITLSHKNSSDSMKKKQFIRFNESTCSSVDSQKSVTNKLLNNFMAVEKQFVDSLLFGKQRYIDPLRNRKDLISSSEHEILFGNIATMQNIMQKICNRDRDSLEAVVRSYRIEFSDFLKAFENYFSVLKVVDTIIVDKTHHPSFIKFIAHTPVATSNQPLFHSFIQKPSEYYNELQKHLQIILGQYKVDSNEYKEVQSLLQELQISFRKKENKIEAKPILKTLESRLVFTKCTPFLLDIPDRTFIFAGDLLRVEKDKEFPIYALLFSDILIFSTINRDRVLFIFEDPINLKSITESFFNIRKKENEFRLVIETNPNYKDLSPTTRCTPDLIKRSPMREQSRKKSIGLRAQSEEEKKVWQNLISQSVFKIHNSVSENSFREPQNSYLNSNQTEASTKNETEIFQKSKKHLNINVISNPQPQELKESLEKIIEPESFSGNTPESCSANLSQKSLSFSSSMRNESCEGIFDFECDLNDVCNESFFCSDDPFFVDES